MAEQQVSEGEWMTHDVCITKPLRLSDPSVSAAVGGAVKANSSSSVSSSASSLQLEVSRLAGKGQQCSAGYLPVHVMQVCRFANWSSSTCRSAQAFVTTGRQVQTLMGVPEANSSDLNCL